MKRGITIILAAVMALGLGLGGLSVAKNAQGTKEFISDGYILDPSDEEYVTDNVDTQYYFSAGAKYKEKYGSQIVFKSSTGDNQTIDSQHFIHYNDGSLGAFTKGVLMDVSEINDSNYGYYSLTQNTVLIKNGNSYEMTSRGEAMNITEFIWKISDTDYMLVSPNITLNIGSNDVTFSDYVQLTYVDNGIVRLTHQSGTYQTVAADSKLVTQNGTELNLVGKEFIVDGEPVFSLDDMAIDDDSYIDVDENITDQPTIPTFNVINGKDGANGTDGTDGEQGIEGEEGKEGEQGAEGDQGAEGGAGSAGGSGGDGVEGDTGIMGYDGAEGIKGKDAENSPSASDIVSADLKARPTVTVDAGEVSTAAGAYNVTSGSADITLNLNNSDNSLIPGTTKVKVYNKKTWELIDQTDDPNEQSQLASDLENGTAVLQFRNLSADTEYVLVVEGDYEIEDGNTQSGVLFQKTFRTEPIGITIAKDHVLTSEIAVNTKITGSVGSYDVRFFYYDDDQVKQYITTYRNNTSGGTFIVDKDNPAPGTDNGSVVRPNTFLDVKSNTKYYAELANVTEPNGRAVATEGEIELYTLKETPHDYAQAHATSPSIVEVPQMKPTLTGNEKTKSFTVDLAAIEDLDNGIEGYKVEMFKASDISEAITNNTLDKLVPAFSKEMKELSPCSFTVQDTDNSSYRERITAYFNDNEKDVELITLFSDSTSLSGAASTLTVEFIGVDTESHADRITGKIKITDANDVWGSTECLRHIDGTSPLKLEISGEYHDMYTILFNSTTVTGNVAHDDAGKYWTFSFDQIGLHQNSTYTLRVIGPQDTNHDGNITGAEATTYLAGLRVKTGEHGQMVLMGKKRTTSTSAFDYSINIGPQSTNAADVAAATYAAQTLTSMKLTLSSWDGTRERLLGSYTTLVDTNAGTHSSDFYEISEGGLLKNTSFHPYTDAEENPISGVPAGTNGLLLSNSVEDKSAFHVTPQSFGIDAGDASLYSNEIYKITVTEAKDYTHADTYGGGGNDIPFVEGKNVIWFQIQRAHVQTLDPNDAVKVTLLTNDAAVTDEKEADIDNDTVVGMRFRADYTYLDVKQIVYSIYEIDDTKTIAPTDYISENGKRLIKTTDAENNDVFTETDEVVCTKVLQGLHNFDSGDVAPYSVSDVELYFAETKNGNSYSITWSKPDDSTADGQHILKRGKRYIISYRVKADKDITPHGQDVDHWYPDCVYGGTRPLYRSAVISLEKQTPVVERYPLSSTDNAEEWNYRIIDPDNAIPVMSTGAAKLELKQHSAFASVASEGTSSYIYMEPLSGYANVYDSDNKAVFKSLTINGLTSGNYYTVSIPYKVLDSAASDSYITSKPVKHVKNQSVTSGGIYLKGHRDYDPSIDAAMDKLSDGSVRPIVNEGNYRYRLTLMGSDLDKIAALKVEATAVIGGATETVVFDPVYISTYNTVGGVPYGYAYIDQGPLADAGFESHEVTYKITGYYSTASSGLSDFVSNYDNETNKTFFTTDMENLFAFRYYNVGDGTTYYRTRENKNWLLTKEYGSKVLNSLFVPGLTATSSGLVISNDMGFSSSANINMRFYETPLNVIDTSDPADHYDKAVLNNLSLDETGLHSGDEYYTFEKLAKANFDFNIWNGSGNDQSVSLTLGDVVAAIRCDRSNAGATSATFEMSMLGRSTSQVYAKIIDRTHGNTEYKLKQGVSVDDEPVFYIRDDSNYSPIAVDTTLNNFTLRIRGLEKSTEYGVLFFVYDADGHTERPLLCTEYNEVNRQYIIKTQADIKINFASPFPLYTYSSYNTKTASFRFSVPGDEGTGMIMYYEIFNGNSVSGSRIDYGTVNANGTGDYRYYSQNPAHNDPFTADFNPGGTLSLNGTYTVRLQAFTYDWKTGQPTNYTSTEPLGTIVKTFTMPGALKDPAFVVELTPQNPDKLKVTVTTTDEQKAIIDGKYTVELYSTSSEDGTPIFVESEEVTINGNGIFATSHTDSVTFTGIGLGNYLVKVRAIADVDNDGELNDVDDKEIIAEAISNAGSAATAVLGGSGNTSTFTWTFSNLSNFTQVRKILITAYDPGKVPIYNGEMEITPEQAAGTSLTFSDDWSSGGIIADEWYSFAVQYRDATGNTIYGNSYINFPATASSTTP